MTLQRRAHLATIPAFLLIALSFCAAAAYAQTATFTSTSYTTLGSNHVVADLDRDGKADVAGLGQTSAAVMLGNGTGTFQARVDYPVGGQAQDLVAGDFNGDGLTDLLVTITDPGISLSLLAGNGDGTFDPSVNFPNTTGLDSPAVVATDLDGNGKLDVVAGHQIGCYTAPCIVGKSITVLMGNGDGTFQPPREIVVGTPTAKIAVGDFNRDGRKDLGLASDSARVQILLGNGDGTFVQQPTLTLVADPLGVDATDIDVADFNRDGIEDLVVAIALNGSRTAILIGNGDGTFDPPSILTEAGLRVPQYQAVADYNLDGFADLALALANGQNGLFQIRSGNGDGTFQGAVFYSVPPPLSSLGGGPIVAADFDADGKPDIALGVLGANPRFDALRNSTGTTPPPPPAAPVLLSPANNATPAQPVFFDWTDVTAAVSYRIQIDDSSNFSVPLVVDGTVTTPQLTAPTLAARRHWWRVQGINSAGVAGAWSAVRRFTPQGAQTPASLSSLSLSPSTVVGGGTSQGTATLTSAAPAGGAVVTLSSGNPAVATVPSSVTVPGGSTSATFTVTTVAVTSSSTATVTGSYGGATRSATLTVTPQAQTATLTVTATGRSGERVLSSPAGISVPVGSTGSAPFQSGTVITLSCTNGRDAIWSGACSSGGQKTRTCTFTLGANASVTANVQ
jgi:hypothetical protein